MSGPAPKHPDLRQRRNRKPTAASLGAATAASARPLPEREDGKPWHPRAVDLWAAAWLSPMAAEYLDADIPGLLIVADLTHLYWTSPSAKTAAEIRQQRLVYGLDPMARRRLQWEVARAKQAERIAPPVLSRRTDPRLRLVASE